MSATSCFRSLDNVLNTLNTTKCKLGELKCGESFSDKNFNCLGSDGNISFITDMHPKCKNTTVVNGEPKCILSNDTIKLRSCCDIPPQYKNGLIKVGDQYKELNKVCNDRQFGRNLFLKNDGVVSSSLFM